MNEIDAADGAEASSDETTAPWYRPPRQARSRETLDRILDALDGLLAESDFEEITVADIVRHADRTVGSFYARFEDKDASLRALHVRYLDEDIPRLNEALDPVRWRELPLRDAVRHLVGMFVAGYRRPRPSFRPLMVRATRDHGFRSQSTAAARAAALAWRRLVASRRAEVDDVDHQHAADLAFRHLVTRLDHELLYGPVVPAARSSDQELTEELTEVLLDVLAAGRVEVR